MKIRRNKVILIKGRAKIAPEITLGEYERINVDYIALIAALKYPQLLPEKYSEFDSDPTSIYTNIKDILNHWALNEQEYILTREYANYIVDHGGDKVRAIEGVSLEVDWFYETVRNCHKHFGQIIVDCEVVCDKIVIDKVLHNRDEAIKKLQPLPNLG